MHYALTERARGLLVITCERSVLFDGGGDKEKEIHVYLMLRHTKICIESCIKLLLIMPIVKPATVSRFEKTVTNVVGDHTFRNQPARNRMNRASKPPFVRGEFVSRECITDPCDRARASVAKIVKNLCAIDVERKSNRAVGRDQGFERVTDRAG